MRSSIFANDAPDTGKSFRVRKVFIVNLDWSINWLSDIGANLFCTGVTPVSLLMNVCGVSDKKG